jgi:hypothetical protein
VCNTGQNKTTTGERKKNRSKLIMNRKLKSNVFNDKKPLGDLFPLYCTYAAGITFLVLSAIICIK